MSTFGDNALARALQWIFAAFFAVGFAKADAQSPPADVTRGLTWLQSQVNADGTIASEDSSIARPNQVKSEVALTLKQLGGTGFASVATRLQLEDESITETLARKIIVSVAAGGDPASLIDPLLAAQNRDGGFGAIKGFQSNVRDTAWALRALNEAARTATPVAQSASSYLRGKVGANGQIKGTSETQSIDDTALALLALKGQTGTDAALAQISTYLRTNLSASGSWLASDFITASVWIGVSSLISSNTDRESVKNFIRSKQLANGSWGDDPYVTALALRALTIESQTSPTVLASVTGRVIDRNGANLQGVDLRLTSSAGTATGQSGLGGDFSFANLPAGQYQLTLSKSGYNSAQASFTLATGQQLTLAPVTLTANPTTALIRGVVTKASDNAPLNGVTMTLLGTPNRVTTTDAAGTYEFTAVAPGAVTITAEKAGFDKATGSGTASAGQTLTFSPALYASGTTPTAQSRIVGRVVSGPPNPQPLLNVIVSVDGVETLRTAANGQFDIPLTASSHRVTFQLAGYTTSSQDFVLPANTTLNFGDVPLLPVRTSTRITGKITKVGGGALENVAVAMANGPSTTTAADGTYALDVGIASTVTLTAQYANYVSQGVTLSIPSPRDIVQDFTLQPTELANLSFGPASITPPSVTSNTDVVISSALKNTGTAGASSVLVLQVLDSSDKVVDRGVPIDATGLPTGLIELTPNESRSVRARWNSARFAPGTYTLSLRAVTPKSITAGTPEGQLVTETRTTVQVTADSRISGTITANPPVLRIGATSPVALTAVVKNNGNVVLAAQSYRLTATKAGATNSAYTQSVSNSAIAVGSVVNLTFPEWTPFEAGNYDLLLTAENAVGSASARVYVGDTATAVYTVTPTATPIGTQTVKGKIAVTGQDAVSGVITDPLAPLIRDAIVSAVKFNDAEASAWTLRNGCQGCHIQTQGVVGGEVNRRLTNWDRFQRAILVNNTSLNLTEVGTYNEGYPGRGFPQTLTALGLWAMSDYTERDSHAASLRRAAAYVSSTQTVAGRWEYDHPVGWIATNYGSTAINLQSLTEVHRVLNRVGTNGARYYATTPFSVPTDKVSRGLVSQDPVSGDLFLSTTSGEVIRRKVDGTSVFTWTGLNAPNRVLVLPDRRVIAATPSGLLELKSDGTTALLSGNTALADLALLPSGKIMATGFLTNTLYEVDPTDWAVRDWLAGVSGHNLSQPARMYVDADGSFLVTSYGSREIVRFKSDKTFSRVTVQTNGQPSDVVRYQGKWWVSTTTGLYRYNDNWEGERVLFPPDLQRVGGDLSDLLVLKDSGELIAWPANSKTLVKIAPSDYGAFVLANPGQQYLSAAHVSADPSGTIYYPDLYYSRIFAFNADGTDTGRSWGVTYARSVLRLRNGDLIASSYSGLYRLNTDGTTTQLAASGQLSDLVQMPDGTLLSLSVNGRLLAIDTSTWQLTDWLGISTPGIAGSYHIALDRAGSLLATSTDNRSIERINVDKTRTVVVSNLPGTPTDVANFEGKWWVSTNQGLFRYNADWTYDTQIGFGHFTDLQVLGSNRLIAIVNNAPGVYEIASSSRAITQTLSSIDGSINRATNYLMSVDSMRATDSFDLAHQLIGLEAARKFYEPGNAARADAIRAKMEPIGVALRARQNPNGGWGRYFYGAGSASNSVSDSLVTAQVGVALDALNPSARSPEVRKAIEWILSTQDANGSWFSQNSIFSTREAATTWVAIWLPTVLDRLGGIDTDVTVVYPTSVAMANARPTPSSAETLASGEIRYVWPMQGVTAAGREITFDLSFADMQPNEKRAASTEAYLTFKNSFTAEDQRAPIDIPSVLAKAAVDLGIVTDKPAYPANTAVNAPVTLKNDNPGPITGVLTVAIRDMQGNLMSSLMRESQTIPLQAQLNVPTTWNTGTTVVGRYVAHAELRHPTTNELLTSGQALFDIVADGVSLAGTVATDKAVYQPTEQVIITGRAHNRALNLSLNNHRLEERVFAADNTIVFSGSRAVLQISPNTFAEARFPFRLRNAPPQTYRVEQKIFDEAGVLKDTQTTSFRVASSADTGFGLTGTITALPKQVRLGEALNLASTATNSGNAALTNLPLKVVIVDPDQGSVVAEYPTTAAEIAIGATFNVPSSTWTAAGRTNATLLAVLTATIGSSPNTSQLTLATDTFQVLPQIAAGIIATGGTPQSVTITEPYPIQLEATVRDTVNNPLPNVLVTFVAPNSGASVTFTSGNTATTDSLGRASVPVTANATTGAFQVVATTPNATGQAIFDLTNKAPIAASIIVTSGTPQTTDLNKAFAAPLVATVRDNLGNAMSGIVVTFVAPSGAALASATFPAGNTAITGSNGQSSVLAKANGEKGNYTVRATAPGVAGAADFALTNVLTCGRANTVSFTSQSKVAKRTVMTSNTVTVGGLGAGCTAPASITGGAYKIVRSGTTITQKASAGFSTSPQTVQDGDQITLEQTSSEQDNATTTATLSLDGNSYPWSVTTAAAQVCGRASAVNFTAQSNVPKQTLVTSNTVIVSGLGASCTAPASIVGGAYKIVRNGTTITLKASAGFSTSPQTVQDGDQITLEQTSSDQDNTITTATLTLDGNAYPWSVGTAAAQGAVAEPVPLFPQSPGGRIALFIFLVGLLSGLARQAIGVRMRQESRANSDGGAQ
jgi:Carboxypeptidase regulatory-like domain/Prenyltransferase and squalene oxidase repeat